MCLQRVPEAVCRVFSHFSVNQGQINFKELPAVFERAFWLYQMGCCMQEKVLAAECPWDGDGIVLPPPVHAARAASWADMNTDIQGMWVLTQEYGVMNRLIDEFLALLRRAKVRRSGPDIWEMLPLHPKELRFVGVIDLHTEKKSTSWNRFRKVTIFWAGAN